MNTTTRATTRTWTAPTTTRFYDGEVVVNHTVTITRTASGLRAEINGLPMTVFQAQGVLKRADSVTVIHEVLEAPAIGKATACSLHRELGALGYKGHYTLAAEVLGREVLSLAALTAQEASVVRSYAYGQLGRAA